MSTKSTDLNTTGDEVARSWPDAPAEWIRETAVAFTEDARMMAAAPPVPMGPPWCTDADDSHQTYDVLLDERGDIAAVLLGAQRRRPGPGVHRAEGDVHRRGGVPGAAGAGVLRRQPRGGDGHRGSDGDGGRGPGRNREARGHEARGHRPRASGGPTSCRIRPGGGSSARHGTTPEPRRIGGGRAILVWVCL